MAYLYVRYTVSDFNKWYNVFESHSEIQKEHGLVDLQLFSNQKDPNDVIVLFRIEDMERTKAFISAPAAEEAKDESGVIGEPEVLFLDKM